MPPATTAIVPVSSDPPCAAVSMPRASPEATTKPRWPSCAASPRAKRTAAADALRAPTIADRRPVEQLSRPLTISTGGAPSTSASRRG